MTKRICIEDSRDPAPACGPALTPTGAPLDAGDDGAALPPDATLDRSVLADLRQFGGSDIVAELMERFRSDAKARLLEIARAVKHGNAGDLAEAAHGLKGYAATLGATRMAAACHRLERLTDAGDFDGARAQAAELPLVLERTCAALDEEAAR